MRGEVVIKEREYVSVYCLEIEVPVLNCMLCFFCYGIGH